MMDKNKYINNLNAELTKLECVLPGVTRCEYNRRKVNVDKKNVFGIFSLLPFVYINYSLAEASILKEDYSSGIFIGIILNALLVLISALTTIPLDSFIWHKIKVHFASKKVSKLNNVIDLVNFIKRCKNV